MKITPVLVEEKRNSKGECPIKLRIYHGKNAFLSIGQFVKPEQWNKSDGIVRKNHPAHVVLNRIIQNKIEDAESIVRSMQLNRETINPQAVVRRLKGSSIDDDVFKFAEHYFKDFQNKFSIQTLDGYEYNLNRLKSYQNPLYFSDITQTWLRKYESWLRNETYVKSKKTYTLSNNTVHRHWKFLRMLVNAGIKEGLMKDYPFKGFSNPPTYKQTDRTYLTIDEIDLIEELLKKPCDIQIRVTGYYFLLSCYSGLRVSDCQRFNPSFIQGERLILRAKKNGQLVSMKIHARLRNVLDILPTLPPILIEQKLNKYLKSIAELAGIKKSIHWHSSRHSFACRCAELGMSVETVAELLGISPRIAMVYFRITGTKLDTEILKWDDDMGRFGKKEVV